MLQKPTVFARSPWPLLARVHRPPLQVLLFCWKTFKSLVRSVQNIARRCMCKLPEQFFMCANLQPDRKHGVYSQGSGSSTGLGRRRRTHSSNATGAHSPAVSLPTQFPSYTQSKGEELPQTCKRDRKKKTQKTFLQNLIMHNSCIQVCVSSPPT